MSSEPMVNYLNIQLRDMDWNPDNPYSSLEGKFLDTKNKYGMKDTYGKGYQDAFEDAILALNQYEQNGKVRTMTIKKILSPIYLNKIEREIQFLRDWANHANTQLKIPTPPSKGIPSLKIALDYATKFDNFIQSLVGEKLSGNEQLVLEALRDEDFCTSISGKLSKVYSTNAADRAKQGGIESLRSGQDMINSYYEELFSLFCLRVRPRIGSITSRKAEKYELNDKLKILTGNSQASKTARKTFSNRFQQFISKYYPDISSAVDKEILNSLGKAAFQNIYSNFKGTGQSSIINISSDLEGRGISYENEQQLKKMFLQTLREIANGKNNQQPDYSVFNIPGLLEVNESWSTSNTGFYKTVQMQINSARAMFNGTSDDRRQNYGKDGKAIQAEINRVISVFFSFLCNNLSHYKSKSTGKKININNKIKTNLEKATREKLSGYQGWGMQMLNKLSAFGPMQVRGMLGEIATAYAVNIGAGLNTEITGANLSLGGTGQLHYDVVAKINEGTTIGFQVKNYTEKKTETNFYETTIGLGQSAIYKYFDSRDVQRYRWLFANGVFLGHKSGNMKFNTEESLRKKMEDSFNKAIPNFLRINDASTFGLEDQIESDIYVIGKHYYPASYLVAAAYWETQKSMDSSNKRKKKKLFELIGGFPSYSQKYMVKGETVLMPLITRGKNGRFQKTEWSLDTGRQKTKQKYITTGGTTQYGKNNLLIIQKHTRLMDGKIHFSGITIEFKIP